MRLIDADALWKLVIDFRDADPEKMTKRKYVCNAILLALIDEKETLTIDPESLRPKGEWIMRGGKRYCSHCNERACVTRDTDDFWYTKGTDFCPNCGADMRGGSNV